MYNQNLANSHDVYRINRTKASNTITQAHPVDDLYGQCWKTAVSMVTAQTTKRRIAAAIVTTTATTASRVHDSTTKPRTKRTTATSSNAGMAEIPAGTLHTFHASKRSCRTSTFSRGGARVESHCKNSRIHCLTRMANNADARLNTRLKNQSMLIHLADVEGLNDDDKDSEDVVELRKGGAFSKLPSCDEILDRSCAERSMLSTWSNWYDSTTKAVKTAENNPA